MTSSDPWRARDLGAAMWEPCHGWTDGATTWVDAYLRPRAGCAVSRYLDVGCATSDAWDGSHSADTADVAWHAGRVLLVRPYPHMPHIEALIVPAPALTTQLIEQALHRYAALAP